MKIVINKCYGGFSLSPLAVQKLAERKGRPCYFFTHEIGNYDKYRPCSLEELTSRLERLMFSAFDIPNPELLSVSGPEWVGMTMEERQKHNKRYDEHSLSSRPDDRADPDLVAVVEELGERANGLCAELSIVEIPDDVEWEIEEYDGNEWVSEKHRSWS